MTIPQSFYDNWKPKVGDRVINKTSGCIFTIDTIFHVDGGYLVSEPVTKVKLSDHKSDLFYGEFKLTYLPLDVEIPWEAKSDSVCPVDALIFISGKTPEEGNTWKSKSFTWDHCNNNITSFLIPSSQFYIKDTETAQEPDYTATNEYHPQEQPQDQHEPPEQHNQPNKMPLNPVTEAHTGAMTVSHEPSYTIHHEYDTELTEAVSVKLNLDGTFDIVDYSTGDIIQLDKKYLDGLIQALTSISCSN